MAATRKLHPAFAVTEDVRNRFDARCVRSPSGCIFWTGAIQRHGYGAFSIESRKIDSHVAAWRIENGGRPIPIGQLVRHKCNNRACVNTDHLELGTHSQNMLDASANGLSELRHRGEANRNSVLTEPLVLAIRLLHQHTGLSAARIASQLGLARSTVGSVIGGASWKHVGTTFKEVV